MRKAKKYLENRYNKSPDARYGMICSSRDKSLANYGMETISWPKNFPSGRWYNESKEHAESCCALDLAATEFDSQGLELDCTLIGWGTDFILQNGKWNNDLAKNYRTPKNIKNAFTLRRNAYRVLLTRARDGMILYLPNDELLNETREHLIKCGVEDLNFVDSVQ